MFKEGSYFKENFQFIYSLVLIIFIPVAIVANTLWGIRQNQKNMDAELQRKAALAEEIFAGAVADNLDQESGLQNKIDQIMKFSPEIKELSIFKPQDDGFKV